MRRVLNVGGSSKAIAIPPHYDDFEHVLLDINAECYPDIVCDGRELKSLSPGAFDAVYCSHNLEHYYRHEVPTVLAGFLHVLKDGGIAQIRVPDLSQLMNLVVQRKLDVDDVLYRAALGPITVHDVIYGHHAEVARSGQDFFAHKSGFTQKSLVHVLHEAGFTEVFSKPGVLEIDAVATKGNVNDDMRTLFDLPR